MYESYSTDVFEAAYTYAGPDLGASWTKERTAFRLWAPTARFVAVNLYRGGTEGKADLLEQLPMKPDVNGTWVAEKTGDLNGVYYTYLVTRDSQTIEACDPYARTTGINGKRAMVIDLQSTNPAGWDLDSNPNAGLNITDAVIYELHIRDLSMNPSSHIKNKGKFLGVIETGTALPGGIPTGLDHIKSLGITHLHLMPVFDFGSVDEADTDSPQFNWGYDPVNFNVPEGSYSTDPFHGEVRIAEMKRMVQGLHEAGISVVMDVVYNHVYRTEDFCFNRIVPGYFSRISPDGVPSNGSGCGNDTASERSMVRKYIVDSVNYWADEYHIDGFRFDLVGLIDTDTMNLVMKTVREKHPDVIFYGEGWSINTTPTKPGISLTTQHNAGLVPGFAFFSDNIRDLLRGSVFNPTAPGYVSGAVGFRDELDACFMGVPLWAPSPTQTVNYVSCHDDHTLFDRITLALPEESRENRIRRNNLAAAFCLLSQGIPFFQAGEEMLRSKPNSKGGFISNSYRSPDRVNALKWNCLAEPEYRETLEYYRGLIAFRKAHGVLRLTTRDQIWAGVYPIPCENPHMLAFFLDSGRERLFAAFNADTQAVSISLPEGKWNACICGSRAETEPIAAMAGSVSVVPLSALVLVQEKAADPVDVVAALIQRGDTFLICQRPVSKARGLLWEFVGGKVEPCETLEQALVRECREELDVTVEVGSRLTQVIHAYPDIRIRLTLFSCRIPRGEPRALEHKDIRWIHLEDTGKYEFCPADAKIVGEIRRIFGEKQPL